MSKHGLVICSTGLTNEEKDRVVSKCVTLGMAYTANYTTQVQILIAKSVGSEKYKVAVNLGIPVVQLSWLDALETNSSDPIQLAKQYALKPLQGLLICVTGFDADERDEMKQLCEKHGAAFSLDLTKSCTHLIAKTHAGAKYEYAKKWGLHIVSRDWVLLVNSKNSYIEPQLHSLKEPAGDEVDVTQDSLDSYLDACNLFLPVDLDSKESSSYKKQIRRAGGTVSTGVVDGFVTHCIVSQSTLSQSDIRRFSTCRPKVPILSLDWLRNCFESKSLVAFEGYLCGETGVGLLKLHRLNSTLVTATSSTTTNQSNSNHLAPVLSSLSCTKRIKVSKNQYSRSTSNVMDMDLSMSHVSPSNPIQQQKVLQIDSEKYSHLLEPKMEMFHGKRMNSFGFSTSQMNIIVKELEKNGAKYVTSMEMAEFLIVPFDKPPKDVFTLHGKVVTELWLESCLQDKKLINPKDSIVFQPLDITPPLQNFKNYKFGITGFDGLERAHMTKLIQFLGSELTETFSCSNSHLFCPRNIDTRSLKYKKALEWKIPTVNEDWILQEISCKNTRKNVVDRRISSSQPRVSLKHVPLLFTPPPIQAPIDSESSHSTPRANYNIQTDDTPINIIKQKHQDNVRQQKDPNTPSNILKQKDQDTPSKTFQQKVQETPLEIKFGRVLAKAKEMSESPLENVQSDIQVEENQENSHEYEEWLSSTYHQHLKDRKSGKFLPLKPIKSNPMPVVDIETTQKDELQVTKIKQASVIYEDKEAANHKSLLLLYIQNPNQVKKFLMTGIPSRKRSQLIKFISKLGGEFLSSDTWDPQCTHLIVGKPSRTEKILAGCASGAWFLGLEYIEESERQGLFVNEQDYQLSEHASGWNEEEKQTIICAKKWKSKNVKSFEGWNVLVMMHESRSQGFVRVLQAGGAQVSIKPNVSIKYTHILLENINKKPKLEIETFNYEWIEPNYLTSWLFEMNFKFNKI